MKNMVLGSFGRMRFRKFRFVSIKLIVIYSGLVCWVGGVMGLV